MKLTHSEKALLLKTLKEVDYDRDNKVGEEIDQKNLIKLIEKIKSVDPEG